MAGLHALVEIGRDYAVNDAIDLYIESKTATLDVHAEIIVQTLVSPTLRILMSFPKVSRDVGEVDGIFRHHFEGFDLSFGSSLEIFCLSHLRVNRLGLLFEAFVAVFCLSQLCVDASTFFSKPS